MFKEILPAEIHMNSNLPIKVLSVDDHPLIRDGIAFALQMHADVQLVGSATNGGEAIALFEQHRPDVTLMDLQLPDIDGISVMSMIREKHPRARFVVLTTYAGDVQAVRALKAGATGYLLKSMVRNELIDTIRAVHSGQRMVTAEVAANISEYVANDVLTPRETEVLRAIGDGHSNKSVGNDLSISEETVKGHVKNILQKLHANDRTHAILIALKRGILKG
jgi:DNA-binding NarL/FixJ family response regulator